MDSGLSPKSAGRGGGAATPTSPSGRSRSKSRERSASTDKISNKNSKEAGGSFRLSQSTDSNGDDEVGGQYWYKGGVNSNGTRDGQGSYIYKDICNAVKLYAYEGGFAGGVKKDSSGRFTIEGSSSYSGAFADGEMTGEGERRWAEGGKIGMKHYQGEWLRGEMHGKGVWTWDSMNERYEGEFRSNKRHGLGILYKNDEIFKGVFTNHVLGGLCSYIIQNKVSYEGEFANNIIHGAGKAVWNKSATYEGTFEQGLASDSRAFFATLDDSYIYEGRFTSGQLSKEDVSAFIWAGLDRSMCPAVEDPAAAPGGKAKAPAAAAGKKGEAAPIATITGGEIFGKVTVRLGTGLQYRKDIDTAKALVAGGGKAPAKGAPVVEIDESILTILPSNPDSKSVLCERLHKVQLQFQKVISDESAVSNTPHAVGQGKLAGVTLGAPIEFLQRNKNVAEVAARIDRYPPNAFVFKNGKNESFSKRFDDLLTVASGTIDPTSGAFVVSSSAAKAPKTDNFDGISLNYSSFNPVLVSETGADSSDFLVYNVKLKSKPEESLFGDSIILSSDFFISDNSADQTILSWTMNNSNTSQRKVLELRLIKKPLLQVFDRIEVLTGGGGRRRAKCIAHNSNYNNGSNGSKGTFDVQFEDNSIETGVAESNIRLLEKPYCIGDSVEILRTIMKPLSSGSECDANYKGLGDWKACTVEKCRPDGTFDCSYEDGKYETRIPRMLLREKGSMIWTVGHITKRSDDCSSYDVVYSSTDGFEEAGVAENLIRSLSVVKPTDLTPSWELHCTSCSNDSSNNSYQPSASSVIMRWRQDDTVTAGTWHAIALSIAPSSQVDLYYDGDARIKQADKDLDVSVISDAGLSTFDEIEIQVGRNFKGGVSNVSLFGVKDKVNLSALSGAYVGSTKVEYNRCTSIDINCFCGEGFLEPSQIKFLDKNDEGLYVCMIVDSVNSSIYAPSSTSTTTSVTSAAPQTAPALPLSLGGANLVYSKLSSNSQIICRLAPKPGM